MITNADKIEIFRRTELFRELDESVLSPLAERAAQNHLARNEILFLAGEPAEGLFVIASANSDG